MMLFWLGIQRGALFGEDDCVVLSKVRAAIDVGLAVILCVGETLLERESALVEEVISRQIKFVLNALTLDELSKVTIAYEPVWAIGTGETATPEQAQQVHAFIRGWWQRKIKRCRQKCAFCMVVVLNLIMQRKFFRSPM